MGIWKTVKKLMVCEWEFHNLTRCPRITFYLIETILHT